MYLIITSLEGTLLEAAPGRLDPLQLAVPGLQQQNLNQVEKCITDFTLHFQDFNNRILVKLKTTVTYGSVQFKDLTTEPKSSKKMHDPRHHSTQTSVTEPKSS